MRKNKKTIRLTETEMVSMIERIVNEVKREKRNQISESRYNRKRYLMEAEEEGADIDAEIDAEMDSPEPKPALLDMIENFAKNYKKLTRKMKRFLRKHSRKMKRNRFPNIFKLMGVSESYSYNKKRILQEKYQRLILESEGEMILADLEEMDENNPDPVLERLMNHLEKLKRKGQREFREFRKKLSTFDRKIKKVSRRAKSKIKRFFEKIF